MKVQDFTNIIRSIEFIQLSSTSEDNQETMELNSRCSNKVTSMELLHCILRVSPFKINGQSTYKKSQEVIVFMTIINFPQHTKLKKKIKSNYRMYQLLLVNQVAQMKMHFNLKRFWKNPKHSYYSSKMKILKLEMIIWTSTKISQ